MPTATTPTHFTSRRFKIARMLVQTGGRNYRPLIQLPPAPSDLEQRPKKGIPHYIKDGRGDLKLVID